MQQSTSVIKSALLVCIIGFSIVSAFVASGSPLAFDSVISSWVQSFKVSSLYTASKALATIGQPTVVLAATTVITVLGLAVTVFYKRSKLKMAVTQFGFLFAVNFVTYFINLLLKDLFHRPRPLPYIHSFSFPSGHSMLVFSFCMAGAYLLSKHIASQLGRQLVMIFCVVLTLLMGLSRIYLNMHYPTDVIAGFFASGIVLFLLTLLFQRLREFRNN